MPRNQRNVLAPASGGDKPVAPDDLWAQMDSLLPSHYSAPPANAFSIEMFADRKGLSISQSNKILIKLAKDGKLTKVKVGGKLWFSLV